VVPTISFRLLYGLLIIGHGRRQLKKAKEKTKPGEWPLIQRYDF
jgi:hypothetical protein